ncbi:MAG: hypothetical protein RLZZ326_392, partial [Planctomycetota bacterium]
SASWMVPPAEPGGPLAAKTAGNPRRMRVLTDLVHETRSVKKSIWGRFVRCFRPVHAVVSLPSHPGGSPPPLLRSPPRGLVDLSAPPVVVHLAPDGAIVVRQMKIAPGG